MFGVPEWGIGVGMILFFGALGLTVMRLFSPRTERGQLKGAQRQMLEDAQTQQGELDDLKRRMGELEERVDFAERLLAKQREGQRLGPPHG